MSMLLNFLPTLVQHAWCLVCTKIYGKNYSCQPINLSKQFKKGTGYKLDFYNKYITRTGAAIKKVNMIMNLSTDLKMNLRLGFLA